MCLKFRITDKRYFLIGRGDRRDYDRRRMSPPLHARDMRGRDPRDRDPRDRDPRDRDPRDRDPRDYREAGFRDRMRERDGMPRGRYDYRYSAVPLYHTSLYHGFAL